jgi:hypothetical protein
LFADDLRAESVGGGLQFGDIVCRQKSIVVFAEGELLTVQLLLDGH